MDKFKRVQTGLKLHSLYPSIPNFCACGCGTPLTGKQKRWASYDCATNAYRGFSVIKGNGGMIRKQLFEIDMGFCRSCGVYSDTWQADHILPVYKGGGASGLDNYQTLCLYCHKQKHKTIRNYSSVMLFPRKPLASLSFVVCMF